MLFAASAISLVQLAEHKASTLESINHGHYIYKKIWWPLVGEILTLEWEEGTKFTVSLLKDATVVSHFSCSYCLRSSLQLVASAEQPSYLARNRSCTSGKGSFHCCSSTLVSLLLCSFFCFLTKLLPSASSATDSLCSLYCLTRFAQHVHLKFKVHLLSACA